MERAELFEQITAYNMKIEQLYSEWAKRKGISYYALLVIFALQTHSPCTQKEISEKWLLPKQTVHTVIRDMQKKEYVTLEQGRNQKEKLVTLTEEGNSYVQEMLADLDIVENAATEMFSLADGEIIANGLKKFAEAFERELNSYGK